MTKFLVSNATIQRLRAIVNCVCIVSLFVLASCSELRSTEHRSKVWCEHDGVRLSRPVKLEMSIGRSMQPEVNIDDLKVGPRGWIFGATEENGYMFIIDPKTHDFEIWNAGRQTDVTERPFEGDITDFTVWEDTGKLIIVAAHAHPAEIYRYEVKIPDSGLPSIGAEDGEVVFSHSKWVRVGSVARGFSLSGEAILLAGSITRGGLVRSNDDGRSWHSIDYINNSENFRKLGAQNVVPNKYSSLHKIFFLDNRWFISTSGFAPLESQEDQRAYKHFVNGILYSDDGSESWRLSSVQRNALMPVEIRRSIERDIVEGRLPLKLYGLVGETVGDILTAEQSLFAITEMNTISEHPFGGRILRSDDAGGSWHEVYHFDKFRDIAIEVLSDGILIVGSVTKRKGGALVRGQASGSIFLSTDGGRTFTPCPELVASGRPSRHRPGKYWVVGIHSMAQSEDVLAVGTVNEGEAGEVYLIDLEISGKAL